MNTIRCLAIMVIMAIAMLLLAASCEPLDNYPPIINGLEAEADWAPPSGSIQVTCNASDRDGDELSYNWSASGGEIKGEGAAVTWTALNSAGSYNVTVTVTDGRGGEAMKYVTITVRANRAPTITNLVADADWTTPLGSIQVICTASDRDDDELSYEWATDGGDISGTGAVVNWTAPEEVGTYNITVVVTDGHGMEGTWPSVPLSITTGTPPTIEDLIVTAEHKYLKTTTYGYKVGKTKEYDIECIVSDTSGELVYEWSCDGGEISGEGSMITWTAPNTACDVTVMVIVFDVAGYMDNESIFFEVVSCSSCVFG